MNQSVQDDFSSSLDVNAMSAEPDDYEDPECKVSNYSCFIVELSFNVTFIRWQGTRALINLT